ncbi:MAG: DUF1826 domain-containing protein, partial [Gemmataceae bacterium]
EWIHSAPTSALVFLKGHEHPGYADEVHHRSPPVPPGGRRLCVVLDGCGGPATVPADPAPRAGSRVSPLARECPA